MTNWLERLWYPAAGAELSLLQRLALLLLIPLSWVFTAIASQRRQRLSRAAEAPQVPTLIVGNITVGGTGKTPLVIALINRLQADGYRVGVISRGYGGNPDDSTNYPLSVSAHPQAALVGDEPLLIHHATAAPVYVDPDRPRARRALLQDHACDLVISDDGLQHYALSRNFELVVIDAKRGLGNGYCLPAGPLREPPARLLETDAVVINHGTQSLDYGTDVPPMPSDLALSPKDGRSWPMTLLTSTLRPLHAPSSERAAAAEGAQSVPPQPGETVTAVAGIGNPARFFNTLRALGYQVIERPFPDHHDFQAREISDLVGPVVMTEKDAVKCRRLLPADSGSFWVLGVTARLPDEFYEEVVSHLLGVAAPRMR